MTRDREPNWQPLSALPMIAWMIDDALEGTREQYQTLQAARDRPHVLDDALLERVTSVYSVQAEHVTLYEQQLARWEKAHPTPQQVQEIQRLHVQLEQLREAGVRILSLAEELKEGTINRVLEMDDVTLALEFLSGKRKI